MCVHLNTQGNGTRPTNAPIAIAAKHANVPRRFHVFIWFKREAPEIAIPIRKKGGRRHRWRA